MAVPARQALLADGRIVSIRQLVESDTAAVLRLHEQLPERDRYLRFSPSDRLTWPPSPPA